MIMNSKNLKLELDKYKSMLLTCGTNEELKKYVLKEMERIRFELEMINERKRRVKR